jgi:hypothetical protein
VRSFGREATESEVKSFGRKSKLSTASTTEDSDGDTEPQPEDSVSSSDSSEENSSKIRYERLTDTVIVNIKCQKNPNREHKITATIVESQPKNIIMYNLGSSNYCCVVSNKYCMHVLFKDLQWLIKRCCYNAEFKIHCEMKGTEIRFIPNRIDRKDGVLQFDLEWIMGAEDNGNLALTLVLFPHFSQKNTSLTDVSQYFCNIVNGYEHHITYENESGETCTISLEKVIETEETQKRLIQLVTGIVDLWCQKPKYSQEELRDIMLDKRWEEIEEYFPTAEKRNDDEKKLVEDKIALQELYKKRNEAVKYPLPEEKRNDDEKMSVEDKIALQDKEAAAEVVILALRCMKLMISKFEFISDDVHQFLGKKLDNMWEWLGIYFPGAKELNIIGGEIEKTLEKSVNRTLESKYKFLLDVVKQK